MIAVLSGRNEFRPKINPILFAASGRELCEAIRNFVYSLVRAAPAGAARLLFRQVYFGIRTKKCSSSSPTIFPPFFCITRREGVLYLYRRR